MYSLRDGQGTGKLCPAYSLGEGPGHEEALPDVQPAGGANEGRPGWQGPQAGPGISECNVRGEAPKGRQQVT